MAREERPAEQVRPNREPIVAPLVALGADARERRGLGEEGKLNRFEHHGVKNKLVRQFLRTRELKVPPRPASL